MSNYSRKADLIGTVGERVQAFQDATDELDEAVARRVQLNRTDLRCLSVLSRMGGMSASALAEATGLTRGAMTTALDRIEEAGFATRVWDQEDRRTVRVELTETGRRVIAALYGPLARDGHELLRNYTAEELAAVVRYLEDGWRLQRTHAERIRRLGDTSARRSRSGQRTSNKRQQR
jgi:DNA-binding MarR family transcriptional regulator